MSKMSLTRRSVLSAAVLASSATLAKPFVRGAFAAGKLSVGWWDHWTPGANQGLQKLCEAWAAKEKVDLKVDFITSNGDKNLLTIASEAQARTGHDVLQIPSWYAAGQAKNLEPVDDLVNALIKEHGDVTPGHKYLGKQNGHWIAVPTGIQSTAATPCARIDMFKEYVGLDLTKMYPAGPVPDKELVDNWTWEFFLTAAEKCFKGGHPFGLPMSTCSDAANQIGAVFSAYGSQLVDASGKITVKSDETRQVLEWFKRLVQFLPESAFAWDNASNNKALVSGKSALILNPPTAWAVAKRDAPKVCEQLWTFHAPKGPKGRFDPSGFGFWGIWNFSTSKAAAKSLLMYLSTRDSVEKLVTASAGDDIPPYAKLRDFKVWETEEPPKGTMYNYPPRGDVIPSMTGFPAPPAIGVQIYAQGTMAKMIAQCTQQGKSIDAAIELAERELEGFIRS